jgi:hypothetical protein
MRKMDQYWGYKTSLGAFWTRCLLDKPEGTAERATARARTQDNETDLTGARAHRQRRAAGEAQGEPVGVDETNRKQRTQKQARQSDGPEASPARAATTQIMRKPQQNERHTTDAKHTGRVVHYKHSGLTGIQAVSRGCVGDEVHEHSGLTVI